MLNEWIVTIWLLFDHQALQGDIAKLQRKIDSIKESANYTIAKSEPVYSAYLKDKLNELITRWDLIVKAAGRQKENLVASMEKYNKLCHDMKEINIWIRKVELSIADDETDMQHHDVAHEKLEQYKVSLL